MRVWEFRLDEYGRRLALKSMGKLTPWVRDAVCLAAVMAIPCSGGVSNAQQPNGMSGDAPARTMSGLPPMNPLANRTADANRILEDSMKLRENQKRFERLNVQRHKEMTTDTEKLLELANQLRTETAKSAGESLSMEAIRQAEQIEKLAHGVREKMKASVSN
jgi:hypothetical protein